MDVGVTDEGVRPGGGAEMEAPKENPCAVAGGVGVMLFPVSVAGGVGVTLFPVSGGEDGTVVPFLGEESEFWADF